MTRPLRRSTSPSLLLVCGLGALACDPGVVPPVSSSLPADPVHVTVEAPVLTLRPGEETTGTLAWNGAQSFTIAPAPDQYVELVAMQEGVDVVLELYRPDGSLETRVDSHNRRQGPEPLPLIGQEEGPYRLTVRGGDNEPHSGSYRLVAKVARPATERDHKKVEADRVFAYAEALRRQRTTDSLAAAPAHYERALALVRDLGDELREADVFLAWGKMEAAHDRYRAAKQRLTEALGKIETQNRPQELAGCLSALGVAEIGLGNPEIALEHSRRAREINLAHGNLEEAAGDQHMAGICYKDLRQTEAALENLQAALTNLRKHGSKTAQGLSLLALGNLFTERGNLDRAEDAFAEARDLFSSSDEPGSQGEALASLGWVHFMKGNRPEGVAQLEKALALQSQLGNRRAQALTLARMGLAMELTDRLGEAESYLERSGRLFDAIEWREAEALTLAHQAFVALKRGALEHAERGFHKALELAHPLDSADAISTAHYGLAQVLVAKGDLSAASVHAQLALEKYDSGRRWSMNPEFRTSTLSINYPSYSFQIDLLMKLHKLRPTEGFNQQAFEVAERSRARGLLDDLLLPPWNVREAASATAREAERRNSDAINRAAGERQPLLGDDQKPAPRDSLTRELRALLGDADHIEAQHRRTNPIFSSQAEARPLSLAEIRNEVLDDQTVLLEYTLGPRTSYLWMVSKDSFQSYELPSRDRIESKARDLFAAIVSSRAAPLRTDLQLKLEELGTTLLGDALGQTSHHRFLVVPDGDLFLVPFSALINAISERPSILTSSNATQTASFGRVLSYAPSASAAAYLRRRTAQRKAPRLDLAAVGDPVYSLRDKRLAGSALPQHFPPQATHQTDASISSRLPNTSDEVVWLLDLFDKEKTFEALGFAASRQTVLSTDLSPFGIVHFASHAVFDSEFPELSAIVLSQLDERGQPVDGYLRSHDLRKLRLECGLVVVSGCNTGRGKNIRGEGVVGLVSSLLSAGGQQALVSLWEVDDRATAELIKRFYDGLIKDHLPSAEALARAQQSIAKELGWQSPYYWAGFSLVGSGDSPPSRPETKPLR